MSDYNVGKGKPPRKSRFKKGRSGNPKGRPKGSSNLTSEINRELKRPITVKEGGVTKTMPKQTAIAKALVSKSMQGDMRASNVVITMSERGTDSDREDAPVSEEERSLLRRYLPRIQEWLRENE